MEGDTTVSHVVEVVRDELRGLLADALLDRRGHEEGKSWR
jgi:hypothetical protein